MKYTVSITGYGAEVTQGMLPIESAESLLAQADEAGMSIADFIATSQDNDHLFDWYEIDDNFHAFGAYYNTAEIVVEDENGNVIYSDKATNVKVSENNVTESIYPEDSVNFAVGILTCIDTTKGTFTTGTINTEEFNPELLSIKIKALGEYPIIDSVEYNSASIEDLDFGDSFGKDFLAYLDI